MSKFGDSLASRLGHITGNAFGYGVLAKQVQIDVVIQLTKKLRLMLFVNENLQERR